jgi:hypothetical protein
MSYNKNWGPNLFKPRDMTVSAVLPHWAPEEDAIKHLDENGIPLCFLAYGNPTRMAEGFWWTPDILVSSLIGNDPNASDIRLTGFSYWSDVLWSGPSVADAASFLAELDTIRIIDRALERGGNKERTVGFNQPLTGTNVKFGLYQVAQSPFIGWVEQHIWYYKVFGSYVTTTPPVSRQLTVRVYDVATAKPIVGAVANLVSGVTIVASGKTNEQGLVTLNAFNQSYLLKVYVVGYTPYPFEVTVDLTDGNAAIDVSLVYVPSGAPSLPWWLIPVVIGVVGVGAVITLGSIMGRRGREPVYVIK